MLGVARRVLYIHEGHLPSLLTRARGAVVVNSTAGLQALDQLRPLFVTGRAIYAKRGLVNDGPLDDFWRDPKAPDAMLWATYARHIGHKTQVNGSLYIRGLFSRPGTAAMLSALVATRACSQSGIGDPLAVNEQAGFSATPDSIVS
jgi:capsule polysaccharide modification protein KpsS